MRTTGRNYDVLSKSCKKCLGVLPLSAYYTDKGNLDGHRGTCKSCARLATLAWRAARPGYKSPCLSTAEYWKRQATRRRSTRNHLQDLAVSRRWRKKNPAAYRAHITLNNAIRAGKVIKPSECTSCGRSAVLDGHHGDYAKPFEVRWLCRLCHSLLDGRARSDLGRAV